MSDRSTQHRVQEVNGYPTGDRLLAILSALANPHRLRIVAALVRGPVHVSQLARDVHISRPLAYLHLRKLEDAGLVRGRHEVSDDGKAMKIFEAVEFDLLVTPELVALAARTLRDDHDLERARSE